MKYVAIGAKHCQVMSGFSLLQYHVDKVASANGEFEQFARLTEALRDAYEAGLAKGEERGKRMARKR